ncbi:ComEA family DNA-binding protein [Corynebacterium choanae]|uniref:ComE operon protein 1 n=1 Tax=Corynebacterium choanae TaxID=1862358 RepID=A0A3G6JD76_9CORY|nr:helix-hairpin-helix domain-containing protein [Corynebacterium choanae]AZA14104.1 ComE operon protein 1 [Corynebacterium choanae]
MTPQLLQALRSGIHRLDDGLAEMESRCSLDDEQYFAADPLAEGTEGATGTSGDATTADCAADRNHSSADTSTATIPRPSPRSRRGMLQRASIGLAVIVVSIMVVWLASGGPPDRDAVAEVTHGNAANGDMAQTTETPAANSTKTLPDAEQSNTPAAAGSSRGSISAAEKSQSVPAAVVVSVVGAVEHPGVVTLPATARVADALTLAVPRADAALARVNLAAPLVDGVQLYVPSAAEAAALPPPAVDQAYAGGATLPGDESLLGNGAASPSGEPANSGDAVVVHYSTATAAQLQQIPGIGAKTAQAILTYRVDHPAITSIDELTAISGIGPATVDRLRGKLLP